MKKALKYLALTSFSGLLCLFLAFPASAQHRGGSGGSHGGGGGRVGGGGHFGGGGHLSSSRSGGFSGASRGGFSGHSMSDPQHSAGGRTAFSPRANSSFRSSRPFTRSTSRVGVTRTYAAPRGRVGVRGYSYGGSRPYISSRGRVVARGYRTPYYNRYYGRTRYYGPSYWGSRGYWGYHRGYFYHGGFYASLYYPRIGFSIGYLPYGYYPFWWGDAQYYYSNGFYYQYNNSQYTVVEPPLGAEISQLPANAQSIVINGEQYYELNGVYYQPITKDDGTQAYVIAGKDGQLETGVQSQDQIDAGQAGPMPQVGDLYDELPEGTRTIHVNGQTLYVSPDDIYYQETTDTSGNRVYKVVSTPDDEPQY
ncbi:MAG TPA: DUF6515 family protein [Mucilaginibacter sp.]|nr:DUF6515 family protein [Mucilaginibacter sp.]